MDKIHRWIAGAGLLVLLALLGLLVLRPTDHPRHPNEGPSKNGETPQEGGHGSDKHDGRRRNGTPSPGSGQQKIFSAEDKIVLGEEKNYFRGFVGEFGIKVFGIEVVGYPEIGKVRCQPLDAMPIVFLVEYGPSGDVDAFKLPLDTDFWKAIRVRVLRQREGKTFVPLEEDAYEIKVIRSGREREEIEEGVTSKANHIVCGDVFRYLCELSIKPDRVQFPIVIKLQGLVECWRVAPAWNAYQVANNSDPIIIKDRQGSEWDLYQYLKEKAQALGLSGDMAGAEEIYKEMTRRWPQLPWPYWVLGQRSYLKEDYAAAQEYYEKAIYAWKALPRPEDDPVWGGQWASDVNPPERIRQMVEEERARALKYLQEQVESARRARMGQGPSDEK